MLIADDEGGSRMTPEDKEEVFRIATERLEEKWHTQSIDMTDEQIRVYLIRNVWIKNNIPVSQGVEFQTALIPTNILGFMKLADDLVFEINRLTRTEFEGINTEEHDRVEGLAHDTDKMFETYETNPSFFFFRLKEKFKTLTLVSSIILGVGVAVVVLFGGFVLYNYLEAYGTELGKIKARD